MFRSTSTDFVLTPRRCPTTGGGQVVWTGGGDRGQDPVPWTRYLQCVKRRGRERDVTLTCRSRAGRGL